MSKNIAIVGAGVGGLSAGIRLQSQGFNVTIYEKENRPGGKMNVIEGNGFKFDLGPTIVMMPHVYREVFEFAGEDPDDYIPMKKLDPIYSVYFDGERADVSTDLVHLTDYLEGISEEDTAGYYDYISSIYRRYLIAKEHFIEKSFRGPLDFYNPKTLLNALKLKTFSNAHDSIASFVKDERLRKLLSFQTLYIGISPHNGPSIYTIIPMIEMIYGVWLIEGGMYTMSSGMAKCFEKLGGNIVYNSPVEKITFKGDMATGVSVGGKTIPHDIVVCNADFPYAMTDLIEEPSIRGKYSPGKINSMDYSCSCFLLYLGLEGKYDNLEVHNVVFADDFEKNISDIFSGESPSDPSIYVYAPSQIDSSVAPEGHTGLYVLAPVPSLDISKSNWTDETITEYRRTILDKLKSLDGLSNIDEAIVFEKFFTPHDFEEKFNAYNGSTFGLAPTLLQSNYYRPHNKSSKCQNLYFAGSSVHPGAGVPIVLTSGKLAAEEIFRDHKSR